MLLKFFGSLLDLPEVPAILLVAVLFTIIRSVTSSKNEFAMVKGGIPFIGQVFTMLKGSPWDTMAEWSRTYGTVFKFHLFGSTPIVIADPGVLKVVLQTKLSIFQKDTAWTYKPFMVLLGKGLVTAEGTDWRNQRTLIASHLKIDILELIPKMAIEAAERLSAKLDKAKESGSVVEMGEEFRHMALQVIAEAVLSLSPEESDVTFAQMYIPIVEEGNLRTWNPLRMYLPIPAFFKFQRDVARLNDYVTSLIIKRWDLRKKEKADKPNSKTRRDDVLDKLLDAIEPEQWNDSLIAEIRDQIKTFILAGHETSASMLTWTLYELSKSGNEYIDTALSCARKCYKSSKDLSNVNMPGKDEIQELNYIECCLRESLRKYSVVPSVVRVATQNIKVENYNIKKGDTLMLCIQGVHHHPKFWPNPMKYSPERFLQPVAPFTFLPFIEGPRMCLGQFLSILESKLVLSLLLLKYKFEILDEKASGEKHPFMVPIIPKTGLFVKVTDR